jgi:1,4-alpha-glucan branching enzyme
MGCELADEREWSEQTGLDWSLMPASVGVRDLLRDLNGVYRGSPALWSRDTSLEGFRWIAWDDWQQNVLSFVRIGDDGSMLACVANFSGVPRCDYRIGLPAGGRWVEILNTDASCYGGAGVGNYGAVEATPGESHGYAHSAEVHVGAYATVWLTRSIGAAD